MAPLMINEASEGELRSKIEGFIISECKNELEELNPERKVSNVTINDESFQSIKIQLRALGLMTRSIKKRSLKDSWTYWKLTPYGDDMMVKLRALRKQD